MARKLVALMALVTGLAMPHAARAEVGIDLPGFQLFAGRPSYVYEAPPPVVYEAPPRVVYAYPRPGYRRYYRHHQHHGWWRPFKHWKHYGRHHRHHD